MRKQAQHIVLLFCFCLGAVSTSFAVPGPSLDSLAIRNTDNTISLARELLARAIQDAGKRLQRQECGAFFGPAALPALTSAEYKLMSLGPPRFVGNSAMITAARTIIEEKIVLINTDGPFVTPRLNYGGRHYHFNGILTGAQTPIVVSDAEFRVVILLHELGHLLGSFAPDTNDLKQNQANNRAVLRNCFATEYQS